MSAFLLARAITPKTPDLPEQPEAPPTVPPAPPLPAAPSETQRQEGIVRERQTMRRRRGVGGTIFTNPLGLPSTPDTARIGG